MKTMCLCSGTWFGFYKCVYQRVLHFAQHLSCSAYCVSGCANCVYVLKFPTLFSKSWLSNLEKVEAICKSTVILLQCFVFKTSIKAF